MRCSIYDPDPKIIIIDGISVSFPSHHRIEGLHPPTMPNQEHALMRLWKSAMKSTCFIGPSKLRIKILEALNILNCDNRLERLDIEIINLKAVSIVILI